MLNTILALLGMSSFWSSPCSACKYLRRKCTHSCVLAPYFPPHEPYKFLCVHRVFGASNTTKMLNDISPEQREALVSTLVYMADAQIKNSVYGSVGYISILQQELVQLSMRVDEATKKLATYIGPAAVDPFRFSAPAPAQFHHPQFQGSAHFAEQQMMGLGLATGATTPQPMIWNQAQWQRLVEARQRLVEAWQMMEVAQQMMEVAASDAAQEQQMFGSYDQQQQQELLRLSNVEQLGGGVTVAIAKATESAGGLSLHPPSHHHQNLPSSSPSKEIRNPSLGFDLFSSPFSQEK